MASTNEPTPVVSDVVSQVCVASPPAAFAAGSVDLKTLTTATPFAMMTDPAHAFGPLSNKGTHLGMSMVVNEATIATDPIVSFFGCTPHLDGRGAKRAVPLQNKNGDHAITLVTASKLILTQDNEWRLIIDPDLYTVDMLGFPIVVVQVTTVAVTSGEQARLELWTY